MMRNTTNGTDKATCEAYLDQIFETYRLVSVLAEKNDCTAYRLRHKTLEKDLVLHRFPKEVSAYESLLQIHSEHLPLIYEVVSLEDGQIVLEEFIEGLTVAEIMAAGRYRYRGAKRVLRAVCSALAILHQRGFVHRDVKPENIVITKEGRVVLIDFNASRQCSAAKRDTVIMGTVGYASPEQMGVSQSDARTDIYAVGVLLNVMLLGRHPSEKIARGHAGRIVRKCTAVNPDERFQSAESLAKML